MNKLVSKNPIQRFKQGKKIQKFGGGDRFQQVGYTYFPGLRSTDSEYVFYDKDTGNLLTSDVPNITSVEGTVNRGNNYSRYGYSWNSEEYKPKKSSNINLNLDPNRVAKKHAYDKGQVTYTQDKNGIWYAKWNKSDLPNQGYYRVAEGSTGYDRFGNHNILRGGQWVKIKESPRSISVNNIWLKGYKHDEVKDVRAMQNELIKLGLLKGNLKNGTGADGKWGDNTEAAYQTYLNLKTIPTYTKAELTDSTPTTPTIQEKPASITPTIQEEPIQQNDFAYQKSAGYPSSQSRGEQLLNSITLRPEFKYGYGNYKNFNPIKLDLRPMFKQGGQLISRNPIKRFKQKNFRQVAQ